MKENNYQLEMEVEVDDDGTTIILQMEIGNGWKRRVKESVDGRVELNILIIKIPLLSSSFI